MEWFPFITRERTEEEKKNKAKYTDAGLFINPPIPQDDERVLVTTKDGRVEFATFHSFKDGYSYFLNENVENVVAWMPMPEPYKPEKPLKNGNNKG